MDKIKQFKDPKIAIVGCGAVGLFYGAKLALSGENVHFLMRSDYEHVKRKGIKIESIKNKNEYFSNPLVYNSPHEIGPCDLVIIAIKATDNNSLENLIPPLLNKETAILTLQNGLGNEQFLAERFGQNRIMGGLCFVCLNRTSSGVVKHIAQGAISSGEYSGLPLPRTHDIALLFKNSGVPFLVAESLIEQRWKKLVWNIPFNGISITAGCIDTEKILEDESLSFLAQELMKEVIDAANSMGIMLSDSLVEHNIRETKTMGAYRPSSVIDFVEGRPVEIEAIWGEPLRAAIKAGADMEKLNDLYQSIKALDEDRTKVLDS